MHCHRYPDENGDMVSGDGRTVTYAAFGKPTLIAKGAVSVAFKHRADRRVLKRIDTNASGTTTTTYIGARLYEKIVGPSGTKEKHYIGGFAVVTETSTATETRYLHRDHLGSVDTITDESGAVVERMSFDAWGQRREADWAVMTDPFAYVSANTTRGFTNHEQLDPVGLVHMGGRVYEPVLGRFLSADPFVQDNTLTQALNRYSYVLNNPLSYTDPSGFFFSGLSKAFGGIGKPFAAFGSAMKKGLREIAKIPILNSILAAAACAPHPAAPVSCPAYAFASTMAVGGSIGDAVFAAGVAYVGVSAFGAEGWLANAGFSGTERIASAAVFSFAVGSARSGNLKQGAIGAFSAAAGGALGSADLGFVGRTVAAAVVGGVTSELAGGNFVNGAVAGAFANLFAEALAASSSPGGSQRLEASGDEVVDVAEMETFGNRKLSSLIETENSGKLFGSSNDAISTAVYEMQNLGRQYYPEDFAARVILPELGVEVYEVYNGRSIVGYKYDGIRVGYRVLEKGIGGVFFADPGSPRIAARAHMHWVNQNLSSGDLSNADYYYGIRQSYGKGYDSYVGSFEGFAFDYRDGKTLYAREGYEQF